MPSPFDNDPEQPSDHRRSTKRLGDMLAENQVVEPFKSGSSDVLINLHWQERRELRAARPKAVRR